MITLYDYGPSQNAWKVREVLRRFGTPYRTEPVAIFSGAGQDPAFLAISPTGQVPAVRFADGTTIAESNAILLALAEGSALLPAEGQARWRVLSWLFFEQNALEPNLGALRHWRLTGKAARRDPAILAAREASGRHALAVLQRSLTDRSFAAGEALTIADIALYAYGHAADDAGVPLADYPAVAAWAERVRAHDGPLCPVIPYSTDPESWRELP